MEESWVEKYHPSQKDDIVGNPLQMNLLKSESIIKGINLPNTIICGPHGTGKSSILKIISESFTHILEIDSLDTKNRNLTSFRSMISNFTRIKTKGSQHKLVIMDDADYLNPVSQQVLRSVMDIYVDKVRFVYCCNNSTGMIDTIQSRCSIVRLSKLEPNDVIERIKYILEKEKVEYTFCGLQAIALNSNGDLRKAVNDLQMVFKGFNVVNGDNVFKICDYPSTESISNILQACVSNNINKAICEFDSILNSGYSIQDIIESFVLVCKDKYLFKIDEDKRFDFMCKIMQTKSIISDGVDSRIQITGLLSKLC